MSERKHWGTPRVHLALLTLLFLLAASPLRAAAPKLPCLELRRILLNKEPVTLLDVRPPDSFIKGHIQGSHNLPAGRITQLDAPTSARIVVYCSDDPCPISAAAAETLIKTGYTDVSILEGGLDQWAKLDYPIQQGPDVPKHSKPGRSTSNEAKKLTEEGNVLILDVRLAYEFSAGHLPRAESQPLEGLDKAQYSFAKNRPIIVYDRDAGRSREAAQKLAEKGFSVSELAGGLAGWVQQGNALEIK